MSNRFTLRLPSSARSTILSRPGLLNLVLAIAFILPAAHVPLRALDVADFSPGAAMPSTLQAKLDKLSQALKKARAAGDAKAEAKALNQVSDVYFYNSDFKQALNGYEKALALAQTGKDPVQEAAALNGIGNCRLSTPENSAAMEAYQQALDVATDSGDVVGQATALSGLGWISNTIGKNQQALDYYRRALPLAQKASDLNVEARVLRRTGLVYYILGDMPKALVYYEQALPLFRRTRDPYREATVLNDLGLVYSSMGEKQEALDYYTKALPIFHRIGDRESEALTWKVIGRVYGDLGNRQAELEYYEKALPVIRQANDLDNEASLFIGIGRVYSILGDNQQAQDYFNQALPLANAANDVTERAEILDNMMLNESILQPALAIFYGKQAVNLLQQVRSNIQGLDKELQQTFLASKEDYYHDLANLLIDQDRIPEALEVLDLLKQQEYSDYVRGDPSKLLGPQTLTPAERQAAGDYEKSTAQLVTDGERWEELKANKARTPAEGEEYQQLKARLSSANSALDAFYTRLYEEFGKGSAANTKKAVVTGNVAALQAEIGSTPRTVGVVTAVSKDVYTVILVTTAVPVARQYQIGEAELKKKVVAFAELLRDPKSDPRPMGEELYKILVGPIEKDLDQALPENLVWSLDGVLRYLPMAALYDGKQYLVEKYSVVTVTPASVPWLTKPPDMKSLTAAAMGISRKYESLPPLTTVTDELDDIVRDARVSGANGVLPGTILLNGQFTEAAMEKELESPPAIVHIASHFVFEPGDDNQSYLLLAGEKEDGNGYHLTVADFRKDPSLTLEGTELLTLSACDTGLGGNARNGEEVDGLASVAQQDKHAKAVISTLWEVNDSSTGKLMADFYQRWADGAGAVMKVQALRLAQLDLLSGRVKPAPDYTNPNAPVDFTHPYYWAPFVLMGNWK